MNESNYWKQLSYKLLTTLRLLFLTTIVWDFFLTVVTSTSQRSKVLLDIGEPFAPFLSAVWIFVIIGLSFVIPINPDKKTIYRHWFAIFSLSLTVLLYATLLILAILNPTITWPLVVNYFMNLSWGVALIYFRWKFDEGYLGER